MAETGVTYPMRVPYARTVVVLVLVLVVLILVLVVVAPVVLFFFNSSLGVGPHVDP